MRALGNSCVVLGIGLMLQASISAQRLTDDLVVLYDFTEGQGSIVHDRGPSLGVPGSPVDLEFDPSELSSEPNAGEFGDRPGLISWGDGWLNINKDHPPDDGVQHGTPDAAVIWDGGPGNSNKIVDMIVETGQFTLEAWVRPASIDNRSNPGRIAWMTVEGTSDASNFVLGQQSCCDGGGQPGGVQIRLNTDLPDTASRVILNSDGFLFEEDQLLHIVHTHDASNEETKVYLNVDGNEFDDAPVIDEFVIGDNLEGWDADYVFALGNDPYRFSRWFGGELHLIAIYNRALTVDDIRSHFELGPGTAPSIPGDFNANGQLDAADLDLLAQGQQDNDPRFDLNGDGGTDVNDRMAWVRDLKNTWMGDANLDGEFNSGDLVQVFQAGLFESLQNATWEQGDWNGDLRFGSGDLVLAFQDGGFEAGPRGMAAVPEPASGTLAFMALAGCLWRGRRRRALSESYS